MNNTKSTVWLTRLDYFFVLRPMLFFPGWATMLAGYFIADKGELYSLHILPGEIDYYLLIRLIVGFGMLMGSAFILNQLADVESDKRNNKLYLISNGFLSKTQAKTETILLALIGTAIGFSCSVSIGILFLIFFIITGVMYNFSPFRLKDKPWGSLIANIFMGWLAFSIGWVAHFQIDVQLLYDSFPYVIFNTALYLYTTLPDIQGDRMSGKETLAVLYGYEKLMVSAFIIISFGFVSVFWLQDMTSLIFYILTMPLFIRGIFIMEVPEAVRTTKYGILFFSLSICLKWPLYFVLMLLGFFFTKFYFNKRFNLNYPNFSGS